MMYKWKLVFTLNSGKTFEVLTECDKKNSDAVAHDILDGEINQYIGLLAKGAITSNFFVKRGEIAALDIIPM